MNARLAVLAAPLALLLALPAAAQHVMPHPALAIAEPVERPVTLQSVRVSTEIGAGLALTSVELTFYNPNRRLLEGELQFPLLPGQTVVGMALELDGKLREAVAVEKARGQMVFEDVTRQRIDPALLEATQGNNYKLRVYPILPERTKQVVIRYSEPLTAVGGRRLYRLPLEYGERVQSFSLRITARGGTGARPTVTRGLAGGLAFVRDGDAWQTRVERNDFAGRGLLELALPAPAGPQIVTQRFGGKRYFYAEVPVATTTAPRTPPGVVGIVWDASGSGATRDHARELALLDAYFRRQRDGEVRLVLLRERSAPPQIFRVANGDWSTLRRTLETTIYDGATSFGAFAPESGVGEYLLFSDGLATFGDAPFPGTGARVHAISAALKSDSTRLRHIAHASGGGLIDLTAQTPQLAAAVLLGETTRVLEAGGEGVADLVLASPYPERGRIAVAGVLTGPTGALRLTLGRNGATRSTREIPIAGDRGDSPLAASQWARLHVAALEGEYELNKAAIRRLGKAFGLVTRETSLIVLDRIEDYARFEIAPPPDLMAEYQRFVGVLARRKRADESAQLERVLAMLREKEAWWRTDFPKGDRLVARSVPERELAPRELRDEVRRERHMDSSRLAENASPPASPPALAAGRIAAEQVAKSTDQGAPGGIAIQLKRWTPDAPYLARLHDAPAADLYRVYLDEKPGYAASTAFFLDAADQLFEKGLSELGVRVLTNLAEMDLENRHILRILGYRLLQAGEPRLALPVFRRVLALAPEEPQSYRDLGLAYAATGQAQRSADMLYAVVVRPWHGRFPEVELIALAELNAIVATAGSPVDTSRFDPRLLKNLPLDLRVVLTWDADNTDIDLWVTDPNGERAFYGRRLTYQGGRMSRDFTGGYGPEEFSLKTAKPGRYRVEANFYGHRQQIVAGATTLQVKLQTRFGTKEVEERIIILRLQSRGGAVMVGEFEVGSGQ
ncbi:MAG TPA: VIT domain-containing protein [Burkholderiales bacterium]|nr:VIT domain-containing protein [Burkholderiales bacterium]